MIACDRHGSRLTGESPVMTLGRREHVGKGSPKKLFCVHLREAVPRMERRGGANEGSEGSWSPKLPPKRK